ncbi:hypothetical protein ISN75_06750 [Dyella marensis]|uniref:hypothetical protein n=1 Tax=Dyella marensis TaxID=500610 RepID=UPI0031DBBC90
MSRARNIKPGFFKNEILAECEPLARILFSGLWCEADRAGRLEDRPKKIKAECLPYDECDIDSLLNQLASKSFILRYEVGGKRYIQILMFAKHQNPHKNEAASSIPAPEPHCTSTVQVPSDDGSTPADSSFLIPDSPSQEDIDARAQPSDAGLAGAAMRKAGCFTLNQSDPDFLEALREGVTPKELADAVTASIGMGISGAGLFVYATKVARTNHAKVATKIAAPTARAGPSSAPGKTMTAIMALEGMKNGLDQTRITDGLPEASHARLGTTAGG